MSRARGRGGADGWGAREQGERGGCAGKEKSFDVGRMLERADSDTSSLSEISISALNNVDLSNESSLMKVAVLIMCL